MAASASVTDMVRHNYYCGSGCTSDYAPAAGQSVWGTGRVTVFIKMVRAGAVLENIRLQLCVHMLLGEHQEAGTCVRRGGRGTEWMQAILA